MTKLIRLAALALAFFAPALATAQTVYEGSSGPVVDMTVTRRYDGVSVTQSAPVYVQGSASTPGYVAPLPVTQTYSLVTQTTGGTAQDALSSNTSRKLWCVQASSTNATVSRVVENGTATSALGTELQPGQQVCSAPGVVSTARVSVWNATTGATYNVVSGQ